jgi:hypothetical protein
MSATSSSSGSPDPTLPPGMTIKKLDQSIKDIARCQMIARAAKKIPKAEVDYVIEHFRAMGETSQPVTEDELRAALVFNRISIPVCNFCSKKGRKTYLMCTDCECTWWCNAHCCAMDAETHKKWCCNPDGPRDMGPMATVFTKLPDGMKGTPGTLVGINKRKQ